MDVDVAATKECALAIVSAPPFKCSQLVRINLKKDASLDLRLSSQCY